MEVGSTLFTKMMMFLLILGRWILLAMGFLILYCIWSCYSLLVFWVGQRVLQSSEIGMFALGCQWQVKVYAGHCYQAGASRIYVMTFKIIWTRVCWSDCFQQFPASRSIDKMNWTNPFKWGTRMKPWLQVTLKLWQRIIELCRKVVTSFTKKTLRPGPKSYIKNTGVHHYNSHLASPWSCIIYMR